MTEQEVGEKVGKFINSLIHHSLILSDRLFRSVGAEMIRSRLATWGPEQLTKWGGNESRGGGLLDQPIEVVRGIRVSLK